MTNREAHVIINDLAVFVGCKTMYDTDQHLFKALDKARDALEVMKRIELFFGEDVVFVTDMRGNKIILKGEESSSEKPNE